MDSWKSEQVHYTMISRKNFLSLLIAGILFLCMFTIMSACSEEKKETYHAEMGITIWTCWPEYERLYYGTRSGSHLVVDRYKENVLTNEKSELDFSVNGRPGIAIVVEFYIVETSTDTVVKTIYPPEENSTAGTYFKYYAIKDAQDRWVETKLDHNIHDLPTPSYSVPNMNYYQLQREAGNHKICFSSPFVPEYDAEPFLFTLNINIKGETRKPVSIRIEDDEAFTKYQISSNRNVYVLNYGAEQAENHRPKIGVYSGDTVVVEPKYPDKTPNPEEELTPPYISAFYRKADENYHVQDTFFRSIPNEAGVYLASFTYSGDDVYAPAEYVCYIVIPR